MQGRGSRDVFWFVESQRARRFAGDDAKLVLHTMEKLKMKLWIRQI